MPVSLTTVASIDPAAPTYSALLDDLQCNILKGHGRNHAAYLFFTFDPTRVAAVKAFIKNTLLPFVTSARIQISSTDHFKATGRDGGLMGAFFLSAGGYQILAPQSLPQDPSFRRGAPASAPGLLDVPDVAAIAQTWEKTYHQEPHAMLLLADRFAPNVADAVESIRVLMPVGVTCTGVQNGEILRNAAGEGIEHFGYVDGRSQPVFLRSDVEHERTRGDGISVWDPLFPLGLVLVPDPQPTNPDAHGSYFVFRKLEQNVCSFKTSVQSVANSLNLRGKDRARAGAQLIGRFEDGTPTLVQAEPGAAHPVPNNFTYADDPPPGAPAGGKCPFHAHMRKANPRGSSAGGLVATRTRLIARRGIPYEDNKRRPRNDDGSLAPVSLDALPTSGVGLLFGAYMASIEQQFEFIQKSWLNDPDFPLPGQGVDPLAGQLGFGPGGTPLSRDRSPRLACPVSWGGEAVNLSFGGHVTVKGMAYLYAPPITFLQGL